MKYSWRVILFKLFREFRILGLIVLVGSFMWGTGFGQALHHVQHSQEICLSDFYGVSSGYQHDVTSGNMSSEYVQGLYDAQCCTEIVVRLALGKSWKHFDETRGSVFVLIGIGFTMLVLSYVVFGMFKKSSIFRRSKRCHVHTPK